MTLLLAISPVIANPLWSLRYISQPRIRYGAGSRHSGENRNPPSTSFRHISQPPIGVRKALASLPSEPCVRFSRTRLSSRWFPHRDWLATHRASFPACQFRFVFVFPVSHLVSRWCHNILTLLTDTTMVKSPSCAKKR